MAATSVLAQSRGFCQCAVVVMGSFLLLPPGAPGAVFTTKLQPDAIAAWDRYDERVERDIAAERPLLKVGNQKPTLVDLNPNGGDGGDDVPDGYIHHWIGAILIPNANVASVLAVLENYPHYPIIYAPDLKLASASKTGENAVGRRYDVRLVTEQVESFGMHFAFDLRLHVTFRMVKGEGTVKSRSYSIRESDSGRAPYSDLLPEGKDHGILWRLNSYWRLRPIGSSVYAECQVISLSRKPLFGTNNRVKSRARESLELTLRQTRNYVGHSLIRAN